MPKKGKFVWTGDNDIVMIKLDGEDVPDAPPTPVVPPVDLDALIKKLGITPDAD